MTPAEREELLAVLREMTGTTHDMVESVLNAKVDAVIEGYKRMSAASMPEWMVAEVLVALAGGDSRRRRE